MKKQVIRQIKTILQSLGIEIRRYRPVPVSEDGGLGDMRGVLAGVRDRGFMPRGIIDVGANAGDWTEMALSVFPAASVIMIEPQIEMFARLDNLCSQHPNLSLVKAGAGSEPGQLVQTIWEDLAGSSFLPPDDPRLLAEGRQRLTKIVTIDSLLAEDNAFHPDLVKLDIQGFELKALAGGASLFGKAEMMILEVSLFEFTTGWPEAREVIDHMGERGYEIYDIAGFMRRPFDGALGQIDIAFARKDGYLRSSNRW